MVTSVYYLVALVLLPFLAVGLAAVLSRQCGRLPGSWVQVATRFSYALAPLGFGMWLAHYSLHLVTSYDTIVPVATRFVHDLGLTTWPEPNWVAACCRPIADYPLRLEILFLDLGLLLSLYTAYRIALAQGSRWPNAMRAFAPWALLIAILFAAGIWLVFQPMQMRGTLGM